MVPCLTHHALQSDPSHFLYGIQQCQISRLQILGETPVDDARLMFSVERFDYTKGIKEKLLAYRRYFQRHPDRIGKDVLYQVRFVFRL